MADHFCACTWPSGSETWPLTDGGELVVCIDCRHMVDTGVCRCCGRQGNHYHYCEACLVGLSQQEQEA